MSVELAGIEKLEQKRRAIEDSDAARQQAVSEYAEANRGVSQLKQEARDEILNDPGISPLEKLGWTYAIDSFEEDLAECAENATFRLEVLNRTFRRNDPFLVHNSLITGDRSGFGVFNSWGSGIGAYSPVQASIEVADGDGGEYKALKVPVRALVNFARINSDEVEEIDMESEEADIRGNIVFGRENMTRFVERLLEVGSYGNDPRQIFVAAKWAGVDLSENSLALTLALEAWRDDLAKSTGAMVVEKLRTGSRVGSLDLSNSNLRQVLEVDTEMVKREANSYNEGISKSIAEGIAQIQ